MGINWIDKNGNFTKGKYKGEPVAEIADEHPGYIQWILSEVKDLDHDEEATFESMVTVEEDWYSDWDK